MIVGLLWNGPIRTQRAMQSFNDCITARDIEELSRWMTDDHVFIDTAGNEVIGKPACMAAWRNFFDAFPDYRNVFDYIQASGGFVVAAGRSLCSDQRLSGPALWSAKVDADRIREWRVCSDTKENRRALGLAE